MMTPLSILSAYYAHLYLSSSLFSCVHYNNVIVHSIVVIQFPVVVSVLSIVVVSDVRCLNFKYLLILVNNYVLYMSLLKYICIGLLLPSCGMAFSEFTFSVLSPQAHDIVYSSSVSSTIIELFSLIPIQS